MKCEHKPYQRHGLRTFPGRSSGKILTGISSADQRGLLDPCGRCSRTWSDATWRRRWWLSSSRSTTALNSNTRRAPSPGCLALWVQVSDYFTRRLFHSSEVASTYVDGIGFIPSCNKQQAPVIYRFYISCDSLTPHVINLISPRLATEQGVGCVHRFCQ